MSDEKEFDLRDKFAMEIINALIIGDTSFATEKLVDKYITAYQLIKWFNDDSKLNKAEAIEKMEQIARTAYKMADVIRKVRLTAFE